MCPNKHIEIHRYAQTDVEFSPDDRLVVTGTSCDKGEEGGKLIFFDKTTFQRAFEMTPTKSHVIRCTWHPKLNQILVGGGDGVVRVHWTGSGWNTTQNCVCRL